MSPVKECKPSRGALKRRGVNPEEIIGLSGLCCKHCAQEHPGTSHHKGMWFPMNFQTMSESAFSQSINNHMMTCKNVPQDIKDAFNELRELATEHNVVTKRGSRKRFLTKVWERMETHYSSS